MNRLFLFLLLVLPFIAFAQPKNLDTDFIIDTSGNKIIGKIKHVNLGAGASQIKFKAPKEKIAVYGPLDIRGWGSGENEYLSKIYPLSKKKGLAVFMHRISAPNAAIVVYEFQNTLGDNHFTEIFLERDSVLTEVLFGKFRKQMKEYFADQPDIVEMIADGDVKKKDLMILVEEYNDLILEQTDALVIHKEVSKEGEQKKRLWNFDDMLLSPEEAAQKFRVALEEETKDILDQSEKDLTINSRIGASFYAQKQYDAAIPYLNKAIDAMKASKAKSSQENQPRTQTILAAIYVNKRNYNLALNYNSEALNKWRNGLSQEEDLNLLHQAYLNQGQILKKLPAASSNVIWYEQVVPETEKDWKKTLANYKQNPIVHATRTEKSDDYSLAFLCLKKADELIVRFPKALQKEKRIETQLALGALFFEAGEYGQSKNHYEKAFMLMDENHPQFAETSRIIGEIYLADQLYSEAIAYIEKAQNATIGEEIAIDRSLLDNISKIPFPFDLLNSITTKGIILYEKNKKNPSEAELKKVLAHYDIATELLHKLRNTHRNEGSNFRLSTITHKFSQHAVIICNTLFELTKKEEYLHEAFRYAELSKSAVLYETIHDLKSMEVSGIPREQIVKENGLKVQIAYLKGEVFYELQQGKERDQERLEALQEKIRTISKEHEDLLRSFEKNYPEYYDLKYSHKGIKLEALQQQLKSNEVFLEYVATDSFIYVLAISNNAIKSQLSELSEPLPLLIKKLQFSLRNNKSDLYENNGRLLYQAVIGDLFSFIENKKLIIAADAELHYIPFGVLPTHKTSTQSKDSKVYRRVHFLIQDHPICYNHSASLYLHSKKQKKGKSSQKIATWAPNFDAMGDIIRDKGIGDELAPLPGAQQEAENIAAMFNSTAYIALNASEAKFKTLAQQYSVLHIATHGVLNDMDPLFSSLIMCNENDEDGILHAFELYNMHLNADLAVLSACNSGMGQLTKGEGVVSIARGFSYAGVPNIVMSKWPVSDWSTAVLMKHFYQNLKAGMPKDEALQQAKIAFLEMNSEKPDLLAPFFWGGFVLSGNTAPIQALIGVAPNHTMLYLGGVALLFLFLAFLFFFKKRFSNKNPVT